MLIDLKIDNVTTFDSLDFSMIGVKSRKKNQFNTVKLINGELLSNVSILYGANGSGKSTFVNILSVLQSITTTDMDIADAYKILAFNNTLPVEISISFISKNKEYLYKISFDNRFILQESLLFRSIPFKGRYCLVFERVLIKNSWKLKFGKYFKYNMKFIKHTISLDEYLSKSIMRRFYLVEYEHFVNSFIWFSDLRIVPKNRDGLNLISADIFARIYGIDFGLKNFLIKATQFADISIGDFKYDNETKSCLVKVQENFWIPLNELSRGELEYLELMSNIYHSKDVIIIDDFGNSLHPKLSMGLLKLIHKTLKKQIIITTHEVMLIETEIRPEQIWFLDRLWNLEIVYTDLHSLCEYRGENKKFERYLVGRFGAIPFINETAFWE